MKTVELKGFKIGDRVRITNVVNPTVNNRAAMIGKVGTIRKLTKCDMVASIRLDGGESWGANLSNIEHAA